MALAVLEPPVAAAIADDAAMAAADGPIEIALDDPQVINATNTKIKWQTHGSNYVNALVGNDDYLTGGGTMGTIAATTANRIVNAWTNAWTNCATDDDYVIYPSTSWKVMNTSTTTCTTSWHNGYQEYLHPNDWCNTGNYEFWGDKDWVKGHFKPPTLSERMADIIRSRNAPVVRIQDRRKVLPNTEDIRELRARETMRRVLGDKEFQRFTKSGFVSITGKSGLVYQIFPGHGITNVFSRGKMVDRLCVVLTGNFPPTDSLMMRYLMILNNEQEFRKYAIVHGVHKPETTKIVQPEAKESLVEIFKKLKQVA